jgi:S-adenosylmethionine:tRNA ribosyltransferase-isomerase
MRRKSRKRQPIQAAKQTIRKTDASLRGTLQRSIFGKGEYRFMNVRDFYFDLPQELIAQDPLEDRSASRLLVLDKHTGEIQHRHFRDILSYLRKGDCLVINDTKVIPARLFGVKEGTEAKIEILLLKRRENDIWETLVKPGKKAKIGTVISFGEGLLKGTVIDVVEEGNRLIQFSYEGIFEEILDRLGQMPLPPYITHQLKDKNRYQTVYAKHEGSAAAPTAGLHFTKELLKEIEDMGVDIAHVTLHVGLGTFRPVKVDEIEAHHMHSEFYIIEEEEAKKVNYAKKNGGRIVCVGTTSCRTVESASTEEGILKAGSGWTEIFIYPGYRFKLLDCLITNFHLPESTLVMLVSALAERDHVLHAYEEAIKEGYRFFSFGDAMLLTDLHDAGKS